MPHLRLMICVAALSGAAAGAEKRDLYGDPLPEGALARLGTSRLRHGGMVRAVAFSPDGNSLISAGGNWNQTDMIRFWDASTGRHVRGLKGHDRGTWSVAFSPDGNQLASIGMDQTIRIRDLATGKEGSPMHVPEGGGMGFLAFSPDGETLATGHGQMVRLWNVQTGKKVRDLGPGGAVVFSRDGKSVVTANIYRMPVKVQGGVAKQPAPIQVYEVETGAKLREMGSEKEYIMSLALSRDGKTLAAGGMSMNRGQGLAVFFDLTTGKELRRASGGQGQVSAMSFSPDGQTLAGVSQDGVIRLWDAESAKELKTLSPAGAAGRNRAGAVYNPMACVAFSPDGNTVVAGSNDGVVRMWDARTGEELLRDLGHAGPVLSLAFSPGAKTILTGGQGVRLWEPLTGKPIRELTRTGSSVSAVAFSPDGNLAAAGSADEGLHVWAASTGKEKLTLDRHNATSVGPAGLKFTRDGAKILCVSYNRDIVTVDIETGKEQRRKKEIPSGMASVAFSNDDRTLATGEQMGLCLWDVSSGDPVLDVPAAQLPKGLGFSPYNDLVAWCTGDLIGLVEIDSGREVLRVTTGRKRWNMGGDLAFSPDGRVVAVGGDEGDVELYDVVAGKLLGKLQGHTAAIRCLEFSRDGKLASGSADTTVLVWDVAKFLRQAGRKTPATTTNPSDEEDVPALWADLSGEAGKAYRASWRLLESPEETVAFFKDHLQPVKQTAVDKVRRLIVELDNPKYAVRTKAYDELSRLGSMAEPSLRETLRTTESEEARARVGKLLEAMRAQVLASPDMLRQARAIRILERIGGEPAQGVIGSLAQGAPGARTTRLAKVALDRMARQ